MRVPILAAMVAGVCAAGAQGAGLGGECRIGMNVPSQYLCAFGQVCLQGIDEKYCSNPGMVCGWPGTGGYALGATRQQGGKDYECFPNGFQEVGGNPAGGSSSSATIDVPNVTMLPVSPKVRPLSAAEVKVARSVFGRSINFSMVRVTNTVGYESRPWTTNTPPLYTINVGVEAFANLADSTWDQLLIHELAHVWQGQHGVPFMSNSAYHQTMAAIEDGGDTSDAYQYKPGQQWRRYNAEQQASIVEHWFAGGRSRSSVLYPYIRDNVRPGQPNATTSLPRAVGSSRR